MKLKDLKDILWSHRGQMQWCILYDWEKKEDIINNCSVEYAIEHYGEREVKRICSCFEDERDNLVIEVI